MANDFNEFSTTPTLTLEPFKEEPKAVEPVKEEPVEVFDDSMLSEEEKMAVQSFTEQIDITNSNMILNYGVGTQRKLSDFSEAALENVRTKDLGEVGELLGDVVNELKEFDDEEEKEKGFFSFLKKPADKITALKTKFAKAETNVNEICKVLENHQVQLLKDVAMLDKMYEVNLTYFKELTMYILAGKKKLQDIRTNDLNALITKAEQTGLPEDAQAARDLDGMCMRFEKKIHDLELTRTIAMQTAPQIRLVQGNDTQMVEKIQSTIVNTIPLWKSQMVLALGVEHSAIAAQAQREVTDMTNELLKKNADKLKLATVETAKETERGVIDIETLKHTNEALISTLDEVMKIQTEGRAKRMEAEKEMCRLEGELKQKLLQIQK